MLAEFLQKEKLKLQRPAFLLTQDCPMQKPVDELTTQLTSE
jgi:hypothetical protein